MGISEVGVWLSFSLSVFDAPWIMEMCGRNREPLLQAISYFTKNEFTYEEFFKFRRISCRFLPPSLSWTHTGPHLLLVLPRPASTSRASALALLSARNLLPPTFSVPSPTFFRSQQFPSQRDFPCPQPSLLLTALSFLPSFPASLFSDCWSPPLVSRLVSV